MSGTKLLVMRVLRKEETHHGPKIVNLSTVLCLIISHLKKQTLYLPLCPKNRNRGRNFANVLSFAPIFEWKQGGILITNFDERNSRINFSEAWSTAVTKSTPPLDMISYPFSRPFRIILPAFTAICGFFWGGSQ